jgi:hypothetical protein
LPAFSIANVTFPCFTFFVDSVSEKSFAVTLTVVRFTAEGRAAAVLAPARANTAVERSAA